MNHLQTRLLSPTPPSVHSVGCTPAVLTRQTDSSAIEHFVCAVANNTWRLAKKTAGDANEARWKRHVDALRDALAEIGVFIKDHDGEPYDVGMAVKVIAWEKQSGATREVIVETIKPTIRWNDKLLQWGEVVACAPVGGSVEEQKKGEQK